jgi:hypothetical protein
MATEKLKTQLENSKTNYPTGTVFLRWTKRTTIYLTPDIAVWLGLVWIIVYVIISLLFDFAYSLSLTLPQVASWLATDTTSYIVSLLLLSIPLLLGSVIFGYGIVASAYEKKGERAVYAFVASLLTFMPLTFLYGFLSFALDFNRLVAF